MELVKLFMGSPSADNEYSPKRTQPGTGGFDSFFAKAESPVAERETTQRTKQSSKTDQRNDRRVGVQRSQDTRVTQQRQNDSRTSQASTSEANTKNDTPTVTDTKPTSDTKRSDNVSNEKPVNKSENETANQDDTIRDKLSEELGIGKELINQILGELNLTPSDLADLSNFNMFMNTLNEKVGGLAAANPQLMSFMDMTAALDTAQGQEIPEGMEVLGEDAENVLTEAELNRIKLFTEISETVENTSVQTEATSTDAMQATLTEPTDNIGNAAIVSQNRATVGVRADETGEVPAEQINNEAIEMDQPIVDLRVTEQYASQTGARGGDSGAMGNNSEQFRQDGQLSNNNLFVNPVQGTSQTNATSFIQNLARSDAMRSNLMRGVDPQEVINQLVERVRVTAGGTVNEVRMTLRPEHLGDVTLKVITENGLVTAQFTAENQRVKEIIESNFNNLKTVLQDQGLNVTGLSVSVGSENKDRNEMFESQRQNARADARRVQRAGSVSAEGTEVQPDVVMVDQKAVYGSSVDYVV